MAANPATTWQRIEAENARIKAPDSEVDRRSTRFIWQAREDIPHAEVIGGVIERCRAMPVVRWLKWERAVDVPLEWREPGMIRRDREGKSEEVAYPTLPGYILDSILDAYRGWGVVELTALKGFDAASFARLGVDEVFFPETKNVDVHIDRTPQTYAELRARVNSVLDSLRQDASGRSSADIRVLIQCGEEMLIGITRAERADNSLIDESEGELELGRTNPQYKQKYDGRDLAALKRLNRPRKDAFMQRLSDNQLDLQKTLTQAIAGAQPQAVNIAEVAATVATAVAAEFAKVMQAQRELPTAPTEERSAQSGKGPQFQKGK